MAKPIREIIQKIRILFSDRVANSIVVICFTFTGYILGGLANTYFTYSNLPQRVDAIEVIDKEVLVELKTIKTDLGQVKQDININTGEHSSITKKLDTVDGKLDTLIIKLVK